ncbi:MAG: hypothetical protein KGJ21_09920 [Pseudomonadota bacterium]|nr:hypothetical protein [Pseudomonadota bacterium]
MTPTEFAEIAAAFAKDPASVQEHYASMNFWGDLKPGATLVSSHTYRLTPKPREWWLNLHENGTAVTHVSKEAATARARDRAYLPSKVVHVREVLP